MCRFCCRRGLRDVRLGGAVGWRGWLGIHASSEGSTRARLVGAVGLRGRLELHACARLGGEDCMSARESGC